MRERGGGGVSVCETVPLSIGRMLLTHQDLSNDTIFSPIIKISCPCFFKLSVFGIFFTKNLIEYLLKKSSGIHGYRLKNDTSRIYIILSLKRKRELLVGP